MNHNKKILSMMRFCEPMARHTTFRIGGPADIWAQPRDLEALKEIIDLCRHEEISTTVVGNGSNLLVRDTGIKGCILNLNTDSFKNIKIDGTNVSVGAGTEISRLLSMLCNKKLGGLEFLAGIPATIGGALIMNAGGKISIGDFIEEVTILDKGEQIYKLDKKEIIFRHRSSNLEKYIVLGAKLKLEKCDKKEISQKIKKILAEKREKQELDKPSAGCVFKNPPDDSAGKLIDLSGLKGKRVGDAVVSGKHANFIINVGKATCDDVLKLMDIIKEKVKKDHGVLLEPEVKILG